MVVDRRNCVRGNAIESRCARANFLIGMLITLRFRVREMLFFPRARSSYYRYALFSWTVGDGDRPMRTEPFVSYGIVRMQPCVRQKSTISFPLHHPLLLISHLSLSLYLFLFLCASASFCPLSPNSDYTILPLRRFSYVPSPCSRRSYDVVRAQTYTRFAKPRVPQSTHTFET